MRKLALLLLVSLWASLFLRDAALPSATALSPATALPAEDDAETKRLIRKGKRVYRLHCQLCHGEDGEHPDQLFSLADNKWRHGETLEDIEANVTQGILGTAMLGFEGRLEEEEIKAVSRYVYTFIEDAEKK